MNSMVMKICTYAGAFAGTLLFLGIWPLAQLFPPLAPDMPSADVAAYFAEHQTGIISGSILIQASSALFFLFAAAIAVLLKKIEGKSSPWTYAFMMIVAYGFVTVYFSGLMFIAAAYRPNYSPEITNMLADLGFFLFVGAAIPAFVQNVITGAAILGDKRAQPIIPRWVGYMNLWTGLLFLPGCVIGLFKVGPFAWNGVLAFWVPAVIFGIWFNIMIWAMLRAINRDAQGAD